MNAFVIAAWCVEYGVCNKLLCNDGAPVGYQTDSNAKLFVQLSQVSARLQESNFVIATKLMLNLA